MSEGRNNTTVQIPLLVLTEILPLISDIDDMQVIVACLRIGAVAENGGNIAIQSLEEDDVLLHALSRDTTRGTPTTRLAVSIQSLLEQNILASDRDSGAIRIQIDPMNSHHIKGSSAPDSASVFSAYEQNIGELTPMIADQIQAAVALYPINWIQDAILEAVTYNRRSWKYIQRILQNWSRDGRGAGIGDANEANRRRTAGSLDPNKYRGGRHLRRAKDL